MRAESRGGPSRLLWATWAVATLAGWACAAFFAAGLYRDQGGDHLDVAVDLSREGEVRSPFTVLRKKPRAVWLSSLNVTEPFGASYSGRFSVRVSDPEGRVVVDKSTDELDHIRRDGRSWSLLGEFTPDRRGRWMIHVRHEGDSAFAGVRSVVSVRPARTVGMEGLINYAAIVPAALFLVVGLALGVVILSRGGPAWPILVSSAPFALTLLR